MTWFRGEPEAEIKRRFLANILQLYSAENAMSKIQWDSQLYLRYEQERTQPSIDLASRIDLDSPAAIIDLGCGPGIARAFCGNGGRLLVLRDSIRPRR